MKRQSPKMAKRKRRYETRPIDSLKPHPAQGELFPDLGEAELQLLADDIEQNGLNHAVEILPDGTIIAGHQRVRALSLLGRTEVHCWVRDSLEKKGEDAIEQRLIEDNLHRRQLSPLGVARCYLRLKKVERPGYYTDHEAKGDLRDHLAKRFGLDGRTLDRYAKMLEAPKAIQFAFEKNLLNQKDVLDVVRLDADVQEEIAERIDNGEDPKSIVREYLTSAKRTTAPATVVARFCRDLDRWMKEVKRTYKRIKGSQWDSQLKVLIAAEKLLPALREHLDKQNEQSKQAFEKSVAAIRDAFEGRS